VLLCCGVIALGLAVALYSDALRVRTDAGLQRRDGAGDWRVWPRSRRPLARRTSVDARAGAMTGGAQAKRLFAGAIEDGPGDSTQVDGAARRACNPALKLEVANGATTKIQPSHAAQLSATALAGYWASCRERCCAYGRGDDRRAGSRKASWSRRASARRPGL